MTRKKSTRAQIETRCRAHGILRPDGKAPQGVTVWTGPSLWDGEPIALVINWSGCRTGRGNSKTGPMVQSYIAAIGRDPVADVRSGADATVCGNCPKRPRSVRAAKRRNARAIRVARENNDPAPTPEPTETCYVNHGQGPAAIAAAMSRNQYPAITPDIAADLIAGFPIRLGTYGDPGMIPAPVWRTLCAKASERTGYTHRAQDVGADLIGLVMASADSLPEALALQADGWRTFRVTTDPTEPTQRGEAHCPAAIESGKKTTCETCPIKCNGSGPLLGRVIIDHGPGGLGRKLARDAAAAQ